MRTFFPSMLALLLLAGCEEDSQNLGAMNSGAGTGGAGQAGAGNGGGGTAGASGSGAGTSGEGGSTAGTSAQGGSGTAGLGGESGASGQGGAGGSSGAAGQAGAGEAGAGGAGPGGAGNGGAAGGAGAGGAAGAGPAATYHARFIFQSGQETIGDFCVAYGKESNGSPIWDEEKLLASNGLVASELDGLQKLSRYIPLKGKPEFFGFTYPGGSCAQATGAGFDLFSPGDSTHFTVIAMPYSGEMIYIRGLGDPVEENAKSSTPGFRIANVVHYSEDISVTYKDGSGKESVLEFPWGVALPQGYQSNQDNFLKFLGVSSPNGSWTVDWTVPLPLVPRRTIFVGAEGALACTDVHEESSSQAGQSNCFFLKNTPSGG
jgi:hypothetical protein